MAVPRPAFTLLALLLVLATHARPAVAQTAPTDAQPSPGEQATLAGEIGGDGSGAPELGEPDDLGDLAGKPIRAIEVVGVGGRWTKGLPAVRSVRIGEPLTSETARRAMRELGESGAFARASVEAVATTGGVVLRVFVLPRRQVATLRATGATLGTGPTLEAAGVAEGSEVTATMLGEIGERVRKRYEAAGYLDARVRVDTTDTDDPARVVVSIDVVAGLPRTIHQRVFVVDPRADRELGDLKRSYKVESGARADERALTEADRDLTDLLRQKGFYRARVAHALKHEGVRTWLYVYLEPGPLLVPDFDGNRAFDDDELREALQLDKGTDTRPAELVERIRAFYVARGYFDAEIGAVERGGDADPVHYLALTIRENHQIRVVERVFPCLAAATSADEAGSEIDSILEEDLPGAEPLSAPSAAVVDALLGPSAGAGGRPPPRRLEPARTYAPQTYDRALRHLRDLFHARGYLNVVVGPVVVARATCNRRSPAGVCIPEPLPPVRATCATDGLGLPLPEPAPPEALTCRPDPKRGIECASELTLRIPIHLGPQTILYDLAFDNARVLTERELGRISELELNQPLSNVEVEAARMRLLDAYRERGYAYAEVRTAIEPSPDRTRARIRFVITEREQVIVSGFVVKGATRTSESLILGRLALKQNKPYGQSLARVSEERIATLGTFSSVSVGLEDAEVPQRKKRVIVTVVEQLPQYLDPRIGFSTGEGLRFGFDYGHRNVGGQAIQLTLGVQLSYLFDFMVLDPDVRRNYDCARRDSAGRCRALPVVDRLERRNTAGVLFPEIGLGPLISFGIDAVDVRDNQRDFGLSKDAIGPSLNFRPTRSFTTQLAGSLELNDVLIFDGSTVQSAIQKNPTLAGLLRVPDGETFVVAQRVGVSWDRRDNPFAATRGTLVAGGVEHVNAFPSSLRNNLATIKSHFLRLTSRIAGYVRLTKKGTALALSLSGGYNVQLNSESQTYPDRLFFLGGVDSIRAFLADSVVPQDVAERILHPDQFNLVNPLKIEDVAIRGGDLSLNPRAELRLPLDDTFQIGVFLDAGNLWVDPSAFDPFALRYGFGAGLRISTPIGPLALDYGINMIRRPWEDFGAFHFSIGLF